MGEAGNFMDKELNSLVANIKAHRCAGSSIADGVTYHDIPGYNKCHRRDTARRWKLISQNIDWKNGANLHLLDIGCSVGGLSLKASLVCQHVLGIDYDKDSIAVAKYLADKYNRINLHFECRKIDEEFVKWLGTFHVTLWLSQWMWLVKEYGWDRAKRMLFDVSRKSFTMVFECAGNDGGAALGKTQEEIGKIFEDNTCYFRYRNLGVIPGWGERNIYIGDKHSVSTPASVIHRIQPEVVRKIFRDSAMWQLDREVKALRRLEDYDNFPKIIDVGNNYIDMSYCGSVAETFDDAQCAVILKALKDCRLTHRDIRKDNILTRNDKLYLIDFGWVLFDDEKDTPTPAPDALGTFNYKNKVWDDEKAMRITRELWM